MKDKLINFIILGIYWPIVARYYRLKNYCLDLIGYEIIIPMYPNPLCKWPVNKPCFCDKKPKKKAKKCCLPGISTKLDIDDYIKINLRLRQKGVIL